MWGIGLRFTRLNFHDWINGVVSTSDKDTCRKNSYGHPTLSPGVFTVYCEDSVCYGFEILRKCESPRHPFRIFKSRFLQAPELTIYDNACHLHIYSLNREPQFFKHTKFLVGRLHWRGHIDCFKLHCSLFLALKNMDTISVLSVANLVL